MRLLKRSSGRFAPRINDYTYPENRTPRGTVKNRIKVTTKDVETGTRRSRREQR